MDSMSWSIFIMVHVLALQFCLGEKPCVVWSSTGGSVVQRGHTFQVYCTFKTDCKVSMNDDPRYELEHKYFNSTTVYFNVPNITTDKTYRCGCKNFPLLDKCGWDIHTGYPPDRPQNISCIYKILRNESGVVVCTWNQGRETYLPDSSLLWVITGSGNHSHGPVSYSVSRQGTQPPSANFTVFHSSQFISVWIQAKNPLEAVNSSMINHTLSDIAMPPSPLLDQPKCSSGVCNIQVKQPLRTEHLEIQYRAEREESWSTYLDSAVQWSPSLVQSLHSLKPYRLYHFRARSKFSTGYWSEWSANICSWTQEEVPNKELDVWFTEINSNYLTVYWKELSMSESRGLILEYVVTVKPGVVISLGAHVRNHSLPFCTPHCEVMVQARNSKGVSPPAVINTRRSKAKPLKDVSVKKNNNSVTISWGKAEHTPHPSVLEWFPEGLKQEELRWLRLGRNDHHAVISDIRPFECYKATVYALNNDNSTSQIIFKAVATLESAPSVSPVVRDEVVGNVVIITWTKPPRAHRGGCIIKYTIYLEKDGTNWKNYSVPASEKTFTIKDLSPGAYSLWMSASTAKGEGPTGQKCPLQIQQESLLSLFLVCIIGVTVLFLILCLFQSSSVKQRFWSIFQCLMLEVVPDPANSKWAKEFSQEKGKMSLQLQLSGSSMTEEEEAIFVEVKELPLPLPPQSTESTTQLYPLTTYIKSLSHDSDSSDHTQTSMDTSTTVDYISSHGLRNMDEEDEEEDEEEEEEFMGMGFLPSQNIFGGKLTLDAVKIDCSNLFHI